MTLRVRRRAIGLNDGLDQRDFHPKPKTLGAPHVLLAHHLPLCASQLRILPTARITDDALSCRVRAPGLTWR